jgi:hypothetical protein
VLHVTELVTAWEGGGGKSNPDTKRALCGENEIDNQPACTHSPSQKSEEIYVKSAVWVGRWVYNSLSCTGYTRPLPQFIKQMKLKKNGTLAKLKLYYGHCIQNQMPSFIMVLPP